MIEKVNKYFGDLDPDDVANAAERFEHILEAVSKDPALQQQAANNPAEDLVHSPGVIRAIEDAQWQVDETEKRITDFIQQQDPMVILEFLLKEMDLYGRLRRGSSTA
ncbi:hypothetical protein DWB68_11605 [Galactobacter valiniphilus]|uniref:Uncharacterized protein n=1 Tax=Galactobacter valiniphilus TaxID=2676122 RepID=A0A399JBI5_9MICC|nr:hypothetical protein [Galactobacter valiniphilus]RII41589.1 hypothetical protein DWB68_11605 [Galactobacter valiniphilus]